jgi:hypothetical protein
MTGWRWLLPALLAVNACAVQSPPRVTSTTLPRAYEGRYLWATAATESGYQVALTIDAATEANGAILVHGSIHYEPGDNQMTVDGVIDPVTLQLSLRESAPNHIDAVTAGTFEGVLSPDLASLVAIWATAGDGQLGALVLRSCGEHASH